MANIFGLDIETPEEAQRRVLAETIANRKSLGGNVNAQLGFNIADALMRAFGKGGAKQVTEARKRQEILNDGRRSGDAQFIAKQEAEEHAVQVYQAHLLSGGTEEEAQQAAQAVLQTTQGRIQQLTKATEQEVMRERAESIEAGASPVNAELLAMASGASKLREMGGAENIALANQLNSRMTELQLQKRNSDAEYNKHLAQTRKAEEDVNASQRSDVELLQMDREQRRAELLAMQSRGMGEEAMALKQQEIDELDAAIFKATGSAPSTATIKSVGAVSTAMGSLTRTGEVFGSVFVNDDGSAKISGDTINAVGTAMSDMSDSLLKLEALASGANIGVLEDAINGLRKDFITNLTKNQEISQADAVRVYQEVRGAVIAQARSFGGPITESDLEQAMAASGVSTGRLDVFYEKQVSNAEQQLNSLKDTAEVEGALRPGSPLARKIAEQEKALEEAMAVRDALLKSGAFEIKPKPPSPTATGERTTAPKVTIGKPTPVGV
jgi:hypothetical protein